MDALKLLGLSKVRKGNPGKDDLLFDFSKNKTFSLCSVGIKGITGSLKLRDLRQSNNWVEDHMEYSKIKAKGLVICNTFRDIELKNPLKKGIIFLKKILNMLTAEKYVSCPLMYCWICAIMY